MQLIALAKSRLNGAPWRGGIHITIAHVGRPKPGLLLLK
jgi:hypothetical protein